MKHTLIILLTFICVFNSARAQSPAAAIDSLIKYKVITAKDRPTMNWALKESGVNPWRIGVLSGLKAVLLKKEFHIDLQKIKGFMSVNFSGANMPKQDSVNITLHALLEKIRKAGLLTDRVYTNTLSGIDSSHYQVDVQMIGHLSEMSFRLELLAPEKLLPVAEHLRQAGIVSDSSFMKLKGDINAHKIESVIELNNYCKLDKVFDLGKYPDDPGIWLEQLHRDIASMLPNINFTGFSYTAVPDTSYSLPGTRFVISLNCNGHMYKQVSQPFLSKNGKITLADIFTQDFYRIFNKVLTDQQSPLRLHSIMYTYGNEGDHFRRFALIALNAEQAEALMRQPDPSYMFATMESYDNTLTSMRIDSVISGWRKAGLFAHLSDTEVNKAIDKAMADERYSIDGLLADFPGVVYAFNSGTSTSDYSYTSLLKQLSVISHGAFKPSNIRQQKVRGGVRLHYFSRGKTHTYFFHSEFWLMDPAFPAFIKKLGPENSLPGNYYSLPYSNDIIYLTKQQHDDASKQGLLEFEQTVR